MKWIDGCSCGCLANELGCMKSMDAYMGSINTINDINEID